MVIEYLRAQIELGGNEVFFEEPWSLRPSAPVRIQPTRETGPSISVREPAAARNSPAPSVQAAITPSVQPQSSSGEPSLTLLVPDSKPNVSSSMEKDLEPLETATSLEAFQQALMHHPYYRLGPSSPGRIAFGSGPVHPPLMLVGYIPTEEELRMGGFFPGAASELLRKLLESMQHSRNLCYHTWLVKKPLLAPPLPRQIGMLRRILAAEVKLVKPELILILGESTMRSVLNVNTSLHEDGGKALEFAGVRTTAIHDPLLLMDSTPLKVLTWKTHLPRSGFFRLQGS